MNAEQSSKTYVRRRAFNKIHVTSWLIYLEKDGYVRCSFQNCNFMAFDVEEMCNHFGYCKGNSSSAKFECEQCKGRTDSLKKLQLHLSQAHNIGTSTSKEAEETTSESDPAGHGKPSKVLMVSWTCFFDKNNYVKCQTCNYLANTLADMCRHYKVCKQELTELLYVCPVCKGRTMNVNPLLWHMEKSHKIFKAPSQFNHIYKAMITYWQKELEVNKLACCLHTLSGKRDCSYFDLDLIGIIEHSQCCKGPQFQNKREQCPCCPKWTNCKEKLNQHIALSHLKDSPNYKNISFGGNLDEDFIQGKYKNPVQTSTLLDIVSRESGSDESSGLSKDGNAPYLQISSPVCGELPTLLPDSSKSSKVKIYENKASESEIEPFHEVVIPPSLYAIAPGQENKCNIQTMPSVNNHCHSSTSETNMEELRKASSFVSTSNETHSNIIKPQVNDLVNTVIKSEVVDFSYESTNNEDEAMLLENGNIDIVNSEVAITEDHCFKNYKYMTNNKTVISEESPFEDSKDFVCENNQSPLIIQDQTNNITEKQHNKLADFRTDVHTMDRKRKRTYALFQDDTSDEDDSLEFNDGFQTKLTVSLGDENLLGESNESSCLKKPTEVCDNKVLSKNYLRRPKPVKSVRYSPTAHSSTMAAEGNHLLSQNSDDNVLRYELQLVKTIYLLWKKT